MNARRHCQNCIIPNHVLKKLLDHPDLRRAALRTLLGSTSVRGRRSILSQLPSLKQTGELRRTIYDGRHTTTLPGKLVRGEGDPRATDSAVNEAYDGLGATYQLYREVFQRNSIDDKGLRLDATVHYDNDYDNAFWDGQQMVFGDGDGKIFRRGSFTAAIDVIAHELTHGVTQYSAGLAYHGQSGALNESMSDVFGSMVKQYVLKQTAADADWLIGAGMWGAAFDPQACKALRSMKAPGTAYDDPRLGRDPQPATMDGYVDSPDDEDGDWGGVHTNSGIPNHAFYLVATTLGGYSWGDPGRIWYEALKRLWDSATFQDCANTTFDVAGTIFGKGSRQQSAVEDAWTRVGLQPGQRLDQGAQRRSQASGTGDLRLRLANLADDLRAIADAIS